MEKLDRLKEAYEKIEIPDKLEETVRHAIEENKSRRKVKRAGGYITIGKWGMGLVASLVIILAAGANTSRAFAMELQKIPVVGAIVKILTIRSYEEEDADQSISVEIPGIEWISKQNNGLGEDVNKEIYNKCNTYAKEALQRAKEYKKAFMETGGTQEEWEAHHIEIKVGYKVKSQSEEFVSFVVTGTESWTSAYAKSDYYNLNLKSGRYVTLEELLGDGYVEKANQRIHAEIAERKKAGGLFLSKEEGGFESISKDTDFYINEKGNPVIVFGKYEIAPGSMGEPEFEITRDGVSEKENDRMTEETERIYGDNFDVDAKAAAAFADQIKLAVREKDLEKLAELVSYPVYVGITEEGVILEAKEEFLALDKNKIFTKEMQQSIEAAKEGLLEASMAGFTLQMESEEIVPGITFSVVDGKLGITGINY